MSLHITDALVLYVLLFNDSLVYEILNCVVGSISKAWIHKYTDMESSDVPLEDFPLSGLRRSFDEINTLMKLILEAHVGRGKTVPLTSIDFSI